MPKSKESTIIEAFEAFIDAKGVIPATNDGKVNVMGLTRALGLVPSDAQYFHRVESVKLAVNAVAEEQNLKPIGWRAEQTAADQAIQGRITQMSARAKEDAQSAVEAKHAYQSLLQEHRELQAKYAKLEAAHQLATERLRKFESLLPFDRLVAEIGK